MDDELNAEGADSGPVDEEEDDSDGGSIGDGAGGIGTAMRGDTSTEIGAMSGVGRITES